MSFYTTVTTEAWNFFLTAFGLKWVMPQTVKQAYENSQEYMLQLYIGLQQTHKETSNKVDIDTKQGNKEGQQTHSWDISFDSTSLDIKKTKNRYATSNQYIFKY
ncbi:hypothetical protein H5410_016462 [Solanum commersonii]|uniref:Uncharacterized protein n=1 Tax=Solanum commersonii TaxID=4109 RepID=A0A9J5ZWG2_SOLCO|nr:hypothetical protein H5410_016462 [Solanum commersonii]